MTALPIAAHQTSFAARAARLANRFLEPSFPRSADFPIEELKALRDAGFLSISLPTSLGGDGIGVEPGVSAGLIPVLKEIGRGNLSLGRLFEGHVNALLLLSAFGSSQQLADAAYDVTRGQCVFGVWNTGPQGSPRLIPLDDGSYELCGGKTFATGAARIQRALITAAFPDGGWQMCLVPLSEATMRIHEQSWNPLGMAASESFSVEFPGTILPPEALIGNPGDYYCEPAFTGGALRFCAVHLGGAQSLFDACCQFVRALGRENDPFQLQRIGEMAVLIESGSHWLAQAGEWLEDSLTNARDLTIKAQMMRIATEEICTRVIQLVQLSVGARGLSSPEPFARSIRDLQMYLRQAGYDQAFQSVGRHALQESSHRE